MKKKNNEIRNVLGKLTKIDSSNSRNPSSGSVQISLEPTEEKNFEKLPVKDKEIIAKAMEIARKNPKIGLPLCENILENYPSVPVAWNNLAYCYSMLGNYKKATELTEECARLFPDYSFGVINLLRAYFFNRLDF